MPMNAAQIREAIEAVLAKHPGALYGTTSTSQRNANGDAAFEALQLALNEDINAAAQAKEDDRDPAR